MAGGKFPLRGFADVADRVLLLVDEVRDLEKTFASTVEHVENELKALEAAARNGTMAQDIILKRMGYLRQQLDEMQGLVVRKARDVSASTAAIRMH